MNAHDQAYHLAFSLLDLGHASEITADPDGSYWVISDGKRAHCRGGGLPITVEDEEK